MKRITVFIAFLVIATNILLAEEKINVLLISGNNNHNWEKTTPALKAILDESGIFETVITENPDTLKSRGLKSFHVILSNWNNLKDGGNCTWDDETKKALLQFVDNGGGYVFVHAASAANYNWEEYQKLAGATWGKGTTHGKIAPFEVSLRDVDHPVVKGMSNFWITDELWVDMQNYKTANVLADAYAPMSNMGNNEMEPVIFERQYGQGRSFYLVLGHDEQVMKNLGFQALLLRGTEWAAKGEVTQRIPKELSLARAKARKFKWSEKQNSVSLLNDDQVVWQYNFNKIEGKPYFHPLSTIDGTELTWLRPYDHPWHRAIWFSWKFINGLNYWEEDRSTGKSDGITELKSVDYSVTDNFEAEFKLELAYHPPGSDDLLKEDRSIQMSAPDENGNYYMDWESTFTVLADEVTFDRTPLSHEPEGKGYGGYAGFSARLNKNLWNVEAVNDLGETNDLHGKASKWLTYNMKDLKGESVSITIFDHPQNLRHPNNWYITKTTNHPFYYFSPAMLFDSKLILKKGEELHLKYRLLVSPEGLNQETIKSSWEKFKTK